MVDISVLMNALPISALEPNRVASIGGFIKVPKDRDWQERVTLLEPPAGQHVPYIDPAEALDIILRGQGIAKESAPAQVHEAVTRMKAAIEESRWVRFFDDLEPEPPECLPLPDFIAWLRGEKVVPSNITDFIEHVGDVTICTPMFRGPDNWGNLLPLKDLPVLPPPKSMIEFVPGAPWADIDNWGDNSDWTDDNNSFVRWRESIRPVVQALEAELGEPVYYFADLQDDLDDDAAHRFLVLHWCCSYKPESSFVKYLQRVCGASDVEELKAALIEPANFKHPFIMNDAFIGLEAVTCRFDYVPPGTRKTVAVVFSTLEARVVAESLLAQKIGMDACIVAPKDLATDEWVKQATRYCRSWEVRYIYNKLEHPIETLALVDELCVIANETTPKCGFDLRLNDSVEDLLWLALHLGIEAKYFFVDRLQLSNPESSLQKHGVPERVATRQVQRANFTRQLTELRLDNDYCSSGLWSKDGKMLGYDQLDLPFPLIQRIATWQRDFDDTVMPPKTGDEEWWDSHSREEIEIAKMLQSTLGQSVSVKLYRSDLWLAADEVARADENNAF